MTAVQDHSFFFDQTGRFFGQRRGSYMKLNFHVEWERFVTAIKIDRIPSFDVGRSTLDVHQFLFRSDWPFFWPEAALNPET
jgi:hypothetical protein